MNCALLEGLINSIGGTQPEYVLWYNYVPSQWASNTFLVLFGLSTCVYVPFFLNRLLLTVEFREVTHIVQASYFRLWFLLPTAVLCGFLELIGWSARLWSSQHPFLKEPFTIQWVHFDARLLVPQFAHGCPE